MSINQGAENKIKYNGIYRGAIENNLQKFFRFYPDGTVIEATTKSDANEIKAWFKKEKFTEDYHSIGTYHLTSNQIIFSTTAPGYGTMTYQGAFKSDIELQLKSHSLINGNKLEYAAIFIEWDDEE